MRDISLLERAKEAKNKLIEIASEKIDKWRNRKIVKECKRMKLERERREEQTLKEIREERGERKEKTTE